MPNSMFGKSHIDNKEANLYEGRGMKRRGSHKPQRINLFPDYVWQDYPLVTETPEVIGRQPFGWDEHCLNGN